MDQAQYDKVKSGKGFIAALDQSGGSTPKALRQYGITEDQYATDDEMFALMHQMRCRIVNSPAFTGDKVLGAILFEMTMDRDISSKPAARALWEDNGVVPFLKVDKGLRDEADGVQLMKPIDGLEALLDRAVASGVFGTKMRSVIHSANLTGIEEIVAQQFEVGRRIADKGLVPILEPEISIDAPDKAKAEAMLVTAIGVHLDAWEGPVPVMLKVTLPEEPNTYAPLIRDGRVLSVVALSGGYDINEATRRLAQNTGMIASFSRALTQGLSAQQSDAEFDDALAHTIDLIYQASIAG
ncbi:MAG: fructose bisphosphate aldolase [Paracoccaceae bacterium]